MAQSPQPAKPLDSLREQITAFEAAVTLALADPKKEPVHLLRTSTRRIEAQLTLLGLLGSTGATAHTRNLPKLLKRLRRAAGHVRDLDVARDLLKDPAALQTAASSSDHDDSLTATAALHSRLERDCKSLRKALRQQRASAAEDLVDLLRHQGPSLARLLEQRLDSLCTSEETRSLTLTPARLATLINSWTHEQLPAAPDPNASARDLHHLRKVAKLARYMAESTPSTAALAQTFGDLQQAGGTWHDFLQLRQFAWRQHGKHSPLAALLRRLTDNSLRVFQESFGKLPVQEHV